MPTLTRRLSLGRPGVDDATALHGIYRDPAVWMHHPRGRHSTSEQTLALVKAWISLWERDGLGPWIVREAGGTRILGCGGCAIRGDTCWNLTYRLAAGTHGRGYATELSLEAIRQARVVGPTLPVVASLLEHNKASARVAEKTGLRLAHRGPDARNPDLGGVRLVYADRDLDPGALARIVR